MSPQSFFLSSLFYCLVPFFWLNIYLAPVFFSLLSLTVSPYSFGFIFISPQFFPSLLSLTVSPHSFGLIFISPQFFSLSSLSYSVAPFVWLNTYLIPVFPFVLSRTVSSHSFGLIFISPQFFPLFSFLQSRPICLA